MKTLLEEEKYVNKEYENEIENLIIDEWHFLDAKKGMKGTGMAVLNPTYGALEAINEIKSTKAMVALNISE